MLGNQAGDRVCKHCCAVLALCMRSHKERSNATEAACQGATVERFQSPVHENSGGPRVEGSKAKKASESHKPATQVTLTDGSASPNKKAHQRGRIAQTREPCPEPAAVADPVLVKPIQPRYDQYFIGYDDRADDASLMMRGGGLRSIMTSRQAHKMACFLAGKAENDIVMTAFTYDLTSITDALIGATARGIPVTLFVDKQHAMNGTTNRMPDRLIQLKKAGVSVYLSRGPTGSGIQHSKTMRSDHFLIVGSTNWTTSSQTNQEMSVLLDLNKDGLGEYERRIQLMLKEATSFSEEHEQSSKASRTARSLSRSRAKDEAIVSTMDKYRTAKRFSIARARSSSRGPEG